MNRLKYLLVAVALAVTGGAVAARAAAVRGPPDETGSTNR